MKFEKIVTTDPEIIRRKADTPPEERGFRIAPLRAEADSTPTNEPVNGFRIEPLTAESS